MFPVLDERDIGRLKRFGTARRWRNICPEPHNS